MYTALPAAVVVVAIGDALCDDGQVVVIVDISPALQEELDHVGVSSAGRHGQNAGPHPVAAVDLRPILQEDVGNGQVTKPGEETERSKAGYRWKLLEADSSSDTEFVTTSIMFVF